MCKQGIVIRILGKKDFWDEGVDRQVNAWNLYNAKKQFDNSCKICCMQNRRMNCDCCPIKNAFELNASIYSDTVPASYYEALVKDLEKR